MFYDNIHNCRNIDNYYIIKTMFKKNHQEINYNFVLYLHEPYKKNTSTL